MDETLRTALSEGALVLTTTRRLARAVGTAYDTEQLAKAHEAWPTPTILPFASWQERMWRATWPDTLLLAEAQALAVWETCIRADLKANDVSLLREDAAARLAYEANALAIDYGIPEDVGWETTAAYEAFSRWRESFRNACRRHGWLDPDQLSVHLEGAIAAGVVSLPRQVVLVGFGELAPSVRALIAALETAGTVVSIYESPLHEDAVVTLVVAQDEHAEIRLAASWIRDAWRPGMRIGIVVPELERRRESLTRILGSELSPASILPAEAVQLGFDVALGTPLADEPIIESALAILAAFTGELEFSTAALWLHSPFVGESTIEHEPRARAEVQLRRTRRPRVTLARLARHLAATGAPSLQHRIEQLLHSIASASRTTNVSSTWAEAFSTALERMGWPGDRTLISREAQALHAWHRVLDSFAGLDTPLGSLSARSAVHRLIALSRDRVFQPEATTAGVQIVGLLEAAHLTFDRVWVMGLHADALPPTAHAHPLLPPAWQRRLQMPHASPDRERAFAANLISRLRRAAPEVVLSYPERLTLGGLAGHPSPLIADLPCTRPSWPVESHALRIAVHRSATLERVEDVPPSVRPPTERTSMGTAVFRNQSQCPFRAFATHRLAATPLDRPEEELSAEEHGTLVHRALEHLWTELGDSEALHRLDVPARTALISRAAEDALADSGRRLVGRSRDEEHRRLSRLLDDWLTLELQRGPFTVVELEHAVSIDVGGLTIRAKLDRLDRLPDGRHVLLDYKTGDASPQDWWKMRPADPQLLVYAQMKPPHGGDVDALAFAQLRSQGHRFRGTASAEDLLPGVTTPRNIPAAQALGINDWPGTRAHWRATLERLAVEFQAGRAVVDPLASACRYCPLPMLCRVHEQSLSVAGS